MRTIMQTIHPLIVHFPIALLLTTVAVELFAVLLRRPNLHAVSLWNHVLGAVAAGGAVLSGLQAEKVAKHSYEIYEIMERHEKLGIVTLVLAAVTAVWRLWRRDKLSGKERAACVALLLIMVATIVIGAHLGGDLVYEFGVGGSFGRK